MMGIDGNGNTCPFLDTTSGKKSPHGGFPCNIYDERPLACKTYPLIESQPITLDQKCKFCKEHQTANENLNAEIESLAKIKDSGKISDDLSSHNQEKTSFVFNIKDDLFVREVQGETNFITVYYLEYGDDGEDLQEIANLLLKRDKIEKAGLGNMNTFCKNPAKFTFPYSENIVVIEVASEKSHQSVKKYCDQTKRDANRKGMAMTNLLSLSILDQLK